MAPVSPQQPMLPIKLASERRVGRLSELDGLRGVASLVVVFHHVFLASALFGNIAEAGGRPDMFSLAWWFTFTPLHLVWAGTEAVFIFFVLSGYVLASQMSKRPGMWLTYYVQRLPRLYLPAIASVLFALALAGLVGRTTRLESSVWLNDHVGVGIQSAVMNSILIFGVDTLNSPLWSLQWEVWFSLLLPLYLWVAVKSASSPAMGAVVAASMFVLMFLGSFAEIDALKYLPVFALGVLTFSHRMRLRALAESMQRNSRFLWPLFCALGLFSLMAFWMVQMFSDTPELLVTAAHFPQILGGWMLVFIVLHSRRWQSVLTHPWILWMGSRSFSLYLIHEPIVVSVALLFQGEAPVWLILIVSLPMSLALSEGFFRLIERPSHLFSRRMGSRFPQTRQDNVSVSG